MRKLQGDTFITFLGWMIAVMVLFLVGVTIELSPSGTEPSKGQVTETSFNPAHCIVTTTMVGKVAVPITRCYPDSWSISVRDAYGNGEYTCSATQELTESVRVDDTVLTRIYIGAITGSVHCDEALHE